MRLILPLALFAIVLYNLKKHFTEGSSLEENRKRFLMDSGCTEKKLGWNSNLTGFVERWVAKGTLLSKGACIPPGYTDAIEPEKGKTKVYSTIEGQRVRSVDANEGTVSVDFTITMRWLDPNIRTLFSSEDEENGGIVLDNRYLINHIWKPSLYIFNLSAFKSPDEWLSMKTLTLLTPKEINKLDNQNDTRNNTFKTTVEYSVEVKSTIYCDFDHSTYPMDQQMCSLKIGSRHFGPIFALHDQEGIYHGKDKYESDNFGISITFFDEELSSGHNTVGINIQMDRVVNEFILKYYIPCIAIILVSAISFVIPLTAIPGRVGLLVTQFLTLTNLFMYQMVS
jgi:hypothetical protein